MKDKIMLLIQQLGPLLPVEVASKTNLDSFMANAFLSELISDGKIRASKDRIANSPLYYVSGQENRVQQRLEEIKNQSQKTARTYAPSNVNVTPEMQAKRDAFSQRLKEIEDAEQRRKSQPNSQPIPSPNYQSNPQFNTKPTYNSGPSSPTFSLPPPKPLPMHKPSFDNSRAQIDFKHDFDSHSESSFDDEEESKKVEKDDFIDQGMNWLRSEGIEIINEINSKKNEVELLVNAHSDFGKVNFYVRIRQKKSITEADLVSVYASAMEQRCLGVLVTNGKLAKSAELYLEEKSGTLKIKQL